VAGPVGELWGLPALVGSTDVTGGMLSKAIRLAAVLGVGLLGIDALLDGNGK
jgi:hypothetical protein